jgi:hypothetical protein
MSGFKAPGAKMKIGFKLGNLSLDKRKDDQDKKAEDKVRDIELWGISSFQYLLLFVFFSHHHHVLQLPLVLDPLARPS